MRRDVFAGGNTAQGFYSFFSEILPLDRARRRIYLKGSSGSGKSSFLKKLGVALEAEGAEVEYIHCANDDESLDGVCVRSAGISAIDATAPHNYDPELPIVVDRVYDFAAFLDESHINPYRDEIQRLFTRKKYFLNAAYGYLAAAKALYDAHSHLHRSFRDIKALHSIVQSLTEPFESFDKRRSGLLGSERRMFASALTPDGYKSHAAEILSELPVCEIRGKQGMGGAWILAEIARTAHANGYDTEGYYSPYDVSELELLVIPELKLGYIAPYEQFDYSMTPTSLVDLMYMCSVPAEFEHTLVAEESLFSELVTKAIDALKLFRDVHNSLERIYIGAMDFKALDTLVEIAIEEMVQLYKREEN